MDRIKLILILILVSSSSFLLYQNYFNRPRPITVKDIEIETNIESFNPEAISKENVKAKIDQRLILTVPESLLGQTKIGEFQWRHRPYQGESMRIEIKSHRYLIEKYSPQMAGLFTVKLPKDAKVKEYLFIVDTFNSPNKNNRLCSMSHVVMIHPKTGVCVSAHNSCEEADLEEQGYFEDSQHKCPPENK